MEGLGDSSQLLQWLEECCQELESQQGGTDEAARAQVDVLRQQIAALAQVTEQQRQAQLGRSTPSGQAQDELQLAQNLDSLDSQLRNFEAKVSQADEDTQKLLQKGASLWVAHQGLQSKDPS